MHRLLILLFVLGAGTAFADVYRWIDENGQVHFTDKPQAGAEQVKLRETSIYTPPASSESGTEEQTERATIDVNESPEEVLEYESIAIVNPEHNQVVRSNEGSLNVSVMLQPGLQTGHKIRIYLDGTRAAQDLDTTQITLQNMDRGTHSLEVSVIDQQEREMKRSSPVNFHMLRLAEPRTAPFGGPNQG